MTAGPAFHEEGDRARSKILQAQQCCIRSLANFADGLPSHGCYRVPDPRRKSDVLDGRVVGKLWRRIEHRPRCRLPCQALFPQALTVFMERLLSRFMIGDGLFCFATSELLSLSGRETGISALLVVDHFPFAFSPRFTSLPHFDGCTFGAPFRPADVRPCLA